MADHKKIGLLLANLGTPLSPHPKHVYKYLNEFLTDERVIDYPWLKRQLLVRGIIVPFRYRQSAELYKKIWHTDGSPLLLHGHAVKEKLQHKLGGDFHVSLAMRYQVPSLKTALEELKEACVSEIIVFPLFPQYASATTGSVHQKVMESLKHWTVIPKLSLISSYPDHPALIKAFCDRAKQYDLRAYDHILFSFHGLPERQIKKADSSGNCLVGDCCQTLTAKNQYCYRAQCFATARALANALHLSPDDYTICFQSRLGSDPWLQPYASDVIESRAKRGDKKMLVFCPAFVCDCLETICEISIEYAHLFRQFGGEELQLVEGLNSLPAWIDAIQEIALSR